MSESIKFEEAMNRLETIVRQMEQGTLSLEDSMKLYEEGIGLVDRCNSLLDRAELQVTKLVAAKDGNVSTVPFTEEK